MWFKLQHTADAVIVRIGHEIGVGPTAGDLLAQIGETQNVHLIINSSGGQVQTVLELYDAWKSKKVTVDIVGKCYSAAMILATAGSGWIRASNDASLMLHPPVNIVFGGAEEFRLEADFHEELATRICDIFTERTHQP